MIITLRLKINCVTGSESPKSSRFSSLSSTLLSLTADWHCAAARFIPTHEGWQSRFPYSPRSIIVRRHDKQLTFIFIIITLCSDFSLFSFSLFLISTECSPSARSVSNLIAFQLIAHLASTPSAAWSWRVSRVFAAVMISFYRLTVGEWVHACNNVAKNFTLWIFSRKSHNLRCSRCHHHHSTPTRSIVSYRLAVVCR